MSRTSTRHALVLALVFVLVGVTSQAGAQQPEDITTIAYPGGV